jgi:hypothetical protein
MQRLSAVVDQKGGDLNMVVVNRNRLDEEYAYFRINGVPIVPALSTGNGFHHDMYMRGVKDGLLIMMGEKPVKPFRSVDISEIVTEKGTLDEGVAYYSAVELRNSGLPLPIGFEKRCKLPLIYAYILQSSLCYVEVSGKGGKDAFFATKCYGVIQAMAQELAEAEKHKKVEDYLEQLSTSHMELKSGIFHVVKLVPDRGGFRIWKAKVNTNKKDTIVLPMYSIANYMEHIVRFLGEHRVRITYVENGEEQKLETSLRKDDLQRWLRNNNSHDVEKVRESWQNPFCFSELILPDLTRQRTFVTVCAFDILSISPLN